ncbi:MAG: hypothetical protein KBT48_01395 [Firmicutes bacterium]|nr:hypothetical protein [Bacillota bacterium]
MSIGMNFVIAFLAGSVGTVIGGLQGFIMYGFIGLFVAAISHLGGDIAFLDGTFMNLFFLPAVMFNGDVVGAAWCAKKHPDWFGENIGKGMASYGDASVLLAGGIGGVIGYAVFYALNQIGLPADTGAWAMTLVGIAVRIVFKGKYYDKGALEFFTSGFVFTNLAGWAYPIFLSVIVATTSAIFVQTTGITNIGFLVSACTLIWSFFDPHFPATHHITLIAGLTISLTGNIVLAVLFGVIAQIIGIMFEMICNTRCGSHIDPPGVAIALCSLVLMLIF